MCVLQMTQAEYLSLVDYTGRQIRADKRGAIEDPAPAALARLGYRPETWTRQVLAVKSDFSRAMGAVECQTSILATQKRPANTARDAMEGSRGTLGDQDLAGVGHGASIAARSLAVSRRSARTLVGKF